MFKVLLFLNYESVFDIRMHHFKGNIYYIKYFSLINDLGLCILKLVRAILIEAVSVTPHPLVSILNSKSTLSVSSTVSLKPRCETLMYLP